MLLLFAATARAACPTAAPESLAIGSTAGVCDPSRACPNGPITWIVGPAPVSPHPPVGGYQIQPCDLVTWSFGDGTAETVAGVDRVTHDYPTPGNYTVEVTVTNALGSASATLLGAVIATSPSRLSFGEGNVALEGLSPYTIDVVRSLDLTRTVAADAVVDIGGTTIRTRLLFVPGETRRSFNVPIPDDRVYSGTRYVPLTFENAEGGVLTAGVLPPGPALKIVDDDPVPTLSMDPAVSAAEGDAEGTLLLVPLHLSAPMGVNLYVYASIVPVAIGWSDVGGEGIVTIPFGQTSGAMKLTVRGNTLPEPDKTFLITLDGSTVDPPPLFSTKTCFVTLVNDDAALYPAQSILPPDVEVPLTLNIGSPFREPTTVTFTSSDPGVIPVPAPVTIPAGETKVWVTIVGRAGGTAQIGAVVPERKTQPATVQVTQPRRHAAGH